MPRYGEVIRLPWRTLAGKFTLVALTPVQQVVEIAQCFPIDLDAETTRLFVVLAHHAVKPGAVSVSLPEDRARPPIRLLSSA